MKLDPLPERCSTWLSAGLPIFELDVTARGQLPRLQARLLLISGGMKASDVAFDVGYESATQFSREYARFFGAPPGRDVARILRNL